ncbi:MAG: hypothetical protein WC285_06555 [Candidatus Gracilibacteria bacterium]
MHPRSQTFSLNPANRNATMHDNTVSGPWNTKHLEAANNQFQNPVMGLIGSIKSSIANALRGTVNLGIDIITHPIAAITNTAQWGFDLVTKLPARIAVIASDTLSRTTFGRISTWTRQIKEKVHKAMETKAKNGHSAHGHAPGHAANDNNAPASHHATAA